MRQASTVRRNFSGAVRCRRNGCIVMPSCYDVNEKSTRSAVQNFAEVEKFCALFVFFGTTKIEERFLAWLGMTTPDEAENNKKRGHGMPCPCRTNSPALWIRLRFFVYGDLYGGGYVAENFNGDVLFADDFFWFGYT